MLAGYLLIIVCLLPLVMLLTIKIKCANCGKRQKAKDLEMYIDRVCCKPHKPHLPCWLRED